MALDQENIESEDKDKEMSFFEHIDELRKYVLRSVYAIVALFVIAFVYMDTIFDKIVMGPLRTDFLTYRALCHISRKMEMDDAFCVKSFHFSLQNTEMAGQFTLSFKLAFVAGLVMAMPFILYQLWLFIRPALSSKEIRLTRGFVFYTSFLFFAGVLFGYFILSPISVNFLLNYKVSDMIRNDINVSSVLSFLNMIILGTGLIFELPVLMYFFAKIGLISSEFLKKYRKHAFLVILIVAAIATPPDVVSQVILTMPLYSLFELGILIVKSVEKQKEKANV